MAEIAPDDSPPLDPDEGPFELLVPISLRVEVECKVITDSAGDSVDVTIALRAVSKTRTAEYALEYGPNLQKSAYNLTRDQTQWKPLTDHGHTAYGP